MNKLKAPFESKLVSRITAQLLLELLIVRPKFLCVRQRFTNSFSKAKEYELLYFGITSIGSAVDGIASLKIIGPVPFDNAPCPPFDPSPTTLITVAQDIVESGFKNLIKDPEVIYSKLLVVNEPTL